MPEQPRYVAHPPNADEMFNRLRKSMRQTIPRHLGNVRSAVLHMQQLRRRG